MNKINSEGLTLIEWCYAAGGFKSMFPPRWMKKAWSNGEDPSEYR